MKLNQLRTQPQIFWTVPGSYQLAESMNTRKTKLSKSGMKTGIFVIKYILKTVLFTASLEGTGRKVLVTILLRF